MSIYTKVFGDPNKKAIAKMQPNVEKINDLESAFEALGTDELKGKTAEFKSRLEKGETLDDILPEAFATVREAAKRTMGMRHYDVQLMGGMVLHHGNIAEMRTGEGKTLTATLPVYLNALAGRGVHVVTVNDYLAKRDAVWMGQIYDFLGLTLGIIQNQRVTFVYDASVKGTQEGESLDEERDETGSFHIEEAFLRPASRKEAYHCDIVYGTNNEFGFDYLRDNMVQSLGDMVMRPGSEMVYAIIDEVDSILIDEARTPLIISAPAEKAADQYYQFAAHVRNLSAQTDFNVDEKMRSATLTEEGIAKFEKWLGVENIYVEAGVRTVHHIEQALKAEMLFKRDKDYIVDNGEIIIIDEFTGRKMPGRRYSEGLHQAIEAKENVNIQNESQTLATITFQNLFRMYEKISGMTGTAKTEEEELFKIYQLEVIVLPTNKSDARVDLSDRIYKNNKGKYKAIVEKIKECRETGQPILIGTASVEKNEELSMYLSGQGIQHEALNAKNHEREGEIVAQAGRPGAVTLATNMAGRGVDIKLGGNPVDKDEEKQVIDAGGLFVLGTERHESRRIDNQLRGRSARQGDPGMTQFFVSTEDDLMRIFAGDRMKNVMERLNVPEDMPIEQKMITKMLESAQKKVEGHHFDTRKHVLQYDDVLNRHRSVIYSRRKKILELAESMNGGNPTTPPQSSPYKGEEADIDVEEENFASLKDMVMDLIEAEIEHVVSYHTNLEKDTKEWDLNEIYETMRTIFPFSEEEKQKMFRLGEGNGHGKLEDVELRDAIVEFLLEKARQTYVSLEQKVATTVGGVEDSEKVVRSMEKALLLRAIDTLWVEHLESVAHVRQGIGLQGYGQRDPLVEYKKETFFLFNDMLANIQKEVVYSFFKLNIGLDLAPSIMSSDKMTLEGAKKDMSEQGEHIEKKERDETGEKVGRNDPCTCGSGKKYKKCHGK
ncbi:MAG: Protein translocase subunit SecA [Candidatus Magasanikbacteria bacterium GW2011_GWD2_43_18]|nr:MAG: Protein translocase subunit SecA [Candidatus Magasanikbacteria bacterium GW2011_GWC2_42_27]KKT03242.1 MAG: Protein translocase subunit SecA [Candidatus Magasanikbacteria bacterium GW2011_GWD2_43_18]KKT25288.1 MAG: Protein translocase subunit SecA [Candidatus Magasanikbacteria bacterium GW2011_GWA2_43_9]HBB38600.1 preprotein translocase subunit SecA [Candidatus Magasanikbacteria bacterium]HCC13852.1 preprotein translocase subunit SecA [Candidatus Magasanikbacteria bacterium]